MIKVCWSIWEITNHQPTGTQQKSLFRKGTGRGSIPPWLVCSPTPKIQRNSDIGSVSKHIQKPRNEKQAEGKRMQPKIKEKTAIGLIEQVGPWRTGSPFVLKLPTLEIRQTFQLFQNVLSLNFKERGTGRTNLQDCVLPSWFFWMKDQKHTENYKAFFKMLSCTPQGTNFEDPSENPNDLLICSKSKPNIQSAMQKLVGGLNPSEKY